VPHGPALDSHPAFALILCASLPSELLLVTLICNDLPESCRLVHLDQYFAACISFVFFFTGVQASWAKASSSCCFDDDLSIVLFTSFTARPLWSWMSFLIWFQAFRVAYSIPQGYLRSWKCANWGRALYLCFL
jgi:hypothetical protein